MFFTNLGRFTVRRRRLILALTALFVVVAGALGVGAFDQLKSSGFDDPNSESARAHDLLENQFGTGDPNLVVLVTAAQVDSPAASAAAEQLTNQLRAVPNVTDLVSYWLLDNNPQLRSRDGTKAVILARITGSDSDIATSYTDVADRLRGTDVDVTVQLGGLAAVSDDLGTQIGDDLAKAETLSVPVTLVLLIIVFGGLIAAGMPLVVALI